MKILTLVLLALNLIACAETEFDSTDPEFIPYLIELNEMSIEFTGKPINYNMPINFKQISSSEEARCTNKKGFMSSSQEIYVNPENWDLAMDERKLAILLHEIGHCVYGLDHDDSANPAGGHNSVMATQAISGNIFRKYQERYFIEFQEKISERFNGMFSHP